MYKFKKLLVVAIVLTFVVGLFGGLPVAADAGPQADNNGGKQKIISLKELEAMYPMSPEAEAAIVHDIPSCPVIIDGVRYKPEDITLFNGQRLRFSVGNDKQLYAFTTVEGLEKFLQDQFGSPKQKEDAQRADAATLYEHILYFGSTLGIPANNPQPTLGSMNDKASSEVVAGGIVSVLYEDTYYGGDSLALGNGMYPILGLYGFNDKASSAYAYTT